MIKTIIRAMYSAFISIVLISIILAGWTFVAFIFQPSKSGEIINVIRDIYQSQKSVIIEVIDLSKLLIKDKSEKIASENNNPLTEFELLIDQEENTLVDEPSIQKDNGNNPLGIVIEPSLPETKEKTLPEINLVPLDNEQSEVSMSQTETETETETEMDMN